MDCECRWSDVGWETQQTCIRLIGGPCESDNLLLLLLLQHNNITGAMKQVAQEKELLCWREKETNRLECFLSFSLRYLNQ